MRAPDIQPGPMINPEAATSGLQASRFMTQGLQEKYNAIQDLGNKITGIGEKFYHVQQRAELIRAENATNRALMEKLAELDNRTDYQNFDQDWRDFTESQKQKFLKETKLQGPYLDEFVSRYDAHAISEYPQVLKRARSLAIDDSVAALHEKADLVERQIAAEDNPDKARQLKEGFLKDLYGLEQIGVIGKTDAYKLSKGLLGRLAEADAKRIVMSVRNGNMAAEAADKILSNPAELVDLDPMRRIYYQAQIQSAQEKLEKEKESAKVNTAYEALYGQFKDNPDGAIRFLQDPKQYQSLGLNVAQADKLSDLFKAQKRYNESEIARIRAENQKKVVNDFYGLVNNGQPSKALRLMQQAADAGLIDQDDLFKARKMLIETGGEKTPKTAEGDWVKTLIGIYNGTITNPIDLLKNGIRGDKFAQALHEIENVSRQGLKGQFNYFDSAVRKYFKDDKDIDTDTKKLKEDFVKSLHWWMTKEKLTPNDPRVDELADRLMKPVVTQARRFWFDATAPLFQYLGEKRPWVTGQNYDMGRFYDPDIPTAKPEEIRGVFETLKEKKMPVTPGTKLRALTAIREGVPIEKVVPAGTVPAQARVVIVKKLKEAGKMSDEQTIQKVWDLYGNKVFED